MRLCALAFLVAAFAAGCTADSAAPPSPPTTTTTTPSTPPSAANGPMVTMPCSDDSRPIDAAVTVKFAPDKADKCERSAPDPDPVYICDYTETVTWYLANTCKTPVNVSIGPRKSDDATNKDDPLDEDDHVYSSPSPVPTPNAQTPGTATIVARVDKDAKNDCYKYTIEGDYSIDPEIEVRRAGPRKECPSPRPAGSTQAPASGKR